MKVSTSWRLGCSCIAAQRSACRRASCAISPSSALVGTRRRVSRPCPMPTCETRCHAPHPPRLATNHVCSGSMWATCISMLPCFAAGMKGPLETCLQARVKRVAGYADRRMHFRCEWPDGSSIKIQTTAAGASEGGEERQKARRSAAGTAQGGWRAVSGGAEIQQRDTAQGTVCVRGAGGTRRWGGRRGRSGGTCPAAL